MSSPTLPAVAWKNEPCGRWSMTVALAFVRAALHRGLAPVARTAVLKEAEEIVAPAVVEAVAAVIRMLETIARR